MEKKLKPWQENIKTRSKKLVDLHIHTDASDGTWSNQELITQLLNRNIKVFSITDHNTVENSRLMPYHFNNLIYITGVEISCNHLHEEFHILGYGFDVNNKDLLNLLEFNQNVNRESHIRLIKKLKSLYPEINYGEYENYKFIKGRGGWKTLNYFTDIGIVNSLKDYYKLIENSNAWKTPAYKTPEKVIEIIKGAKGIPFLAHPKIEDTNNIEGELMEWVEFGVLGIECYHPKITMDVSKELVKFCKTFNLLISGGSDCHGKFAPKRQLGVPRISENMIDLGGLLKNEHK